MEVYQGTAAFSGIAIGKILYYHSNEMHYRQLITDVREELAKYTAARQQATVTLRADIENAGFSSWGFLHSWEKQLELLEGTALSDAIENVILSEKVDAAYAVMVTRDDLARTFCRLEAPFIKERIENVRRICDKIIAILGGVTPRIDLGPEPVILVANSVRPEEFMEMTTEKLLAVVTFNGSAASHTSILSKNLAIPSLCDIRVNEDWDGCNAIVDGYQGTIYVDPDMETFREYEIRRQADLQAKEELLSLRDKRNVTRDGVEVPLMANIGSLDDLNSVQYYGASGIGLLRSEFQYMGRETYPRENELFLAYKKVAEAMGDQLVIIRTSDLGADKGAAYLEIPPETNPAMGNRGIRLCLDRKRMFKAQLRAIYRASAYGNLAIMYPMITSMEEMEEIVRLTDQVKKGLDEKEIPYKDIMTGIMVETPAAVMICDQLAAYCDFLSLGTNDLTQYTLAMDRQNPLLRSRYNDHHPAVLKMIRMVVEAGHDHRKPVYICGELAADTSLTERFLRMGVDGLSVVPACILPVRGAIREIDLGTGGCEVTGKESEKA